MPEDYDWQVDVDPDYRDDVYFVYKGNRSTKGCICKCSYGCLCKVMILPVEGWD